MKHRAFATALLAASLAAAPVQSQEPPAAPSSVEPAPVAPPPAPVAPPPAAPSSVPVAPPPAAPACATLPPDAKVTTAARIALADCHAAAGRSASAWATLRTAERAARQAGQVAEAVEAARRGAALEPFLVRLTIRFADAAPDAVVTRDGAGLGKDELGLAVPVDPGPHVILAAAPGKEAWTSTIDAREAGRVYEVTIPPLRTAALTPGAAAALNAQNRKYAIGTGIAAAGLYAVGVWQLKVAVDHRADLNATYLCGGTPEQCAQSRAKKIQEAEQATALSAFTTGMGAGLTFATFMLIFMEFESGPAAPKGARPAAKARLSLSAGAAGGGLLLTGSF